MTHRWCINEIGPHCGYLGRNGPAAFIFIGTDNKGGRLSRSAAASDAGQHSLLPQSKASVEV
ncbi:hypothetical protein AU467_25075 [Mesorhizobium loti]|uniref:Uncharacterized protein n=1 Tax=Rhizobium loti TaxID=381 RepID=A0A101KRH7_RHILI|nr:hypothetical protein AU467_25075 [Mesorhizobium loti]